MIQTNLLSMLLPPAGTGSASGAPSAAVPADPQAFAMLLTEHLAATPPRDGGSQQLDTPDPASALAGQETAQAPSGWTPLLAQNLLLVVDLSAVAENRPNSKPADDPAPISEAALPDDALRDAAPLTGGPIQPTRIQPAKPGSIVPILDGSGTPAEPVPAEFGLGVPSAGSSTGAGTATPTVPELMPTAPAHAAAAPGTHGTASLAPAQLPAVGNQEGLHPAGIAGSATEPATAHAVHGLAVRAEQTGQAPRNGAIASPAAGPPATSMPSITGRSVAELFTEAVPDSASEAWPVQQHPIAPPSAEAPATAGVPAAAGHPSIAATAVPATSGLPASEPLAAAPAGAPAGAGRHAAAAQSLHRQLAAPIAAVLTEENGVRVMTVQVAPETLGPVTVSARWGADGLKLDLFAPSEQGRENLRAVLPELRREFAMLGQGSVQVLTASASPEHGAAPSPAGAGSGQHPGSASGQPGQPAPQPGAGDSGSNGGAPSRGAGSAAADPVAGPGETAAASEDYDLRPMPAGLDLLA